MSVAFGDVVYEIENSKVIAFGVLHTDKEMLDALNNEVCERVYDITGTNSLVNSILAGLADTGFKKDSLMDFFTNNSDDCISEWIVGEAYAQAYLEANFASVLPWNLKRDIKKRGSSLPGADIVGLRSHNDTSFFLFGEVKTSSDNNYPPSIMYGPKGLKKQIEELCNEEETIKTLVVYLGIRLINTQYWAMYQNAFVKYYENIHNICIIGVLVRDVEPNDKDLAARAKPLSSYCIDGRQISLIAIYLPRGAISSFVEIVETERERRRSAKC